MELGAGCGLVSVLLARCGAARVLATDIGDAVLANLSQNLREHEAAADGAATAHALDWTAPVPPAPAPQGSGAAVSPWGWSAGDVAALRQTRFIFAADCVYDDRLTGAPPPPPPPPHRCGSPVSRRPRAADAFMSAAAALFAAAPGCEAMYVALERRIVFTMEEMAERAPAYEHWRGLFDCAAAFFVGERVDVAALPQAVAPPGGLARSRQLELWCLRPRRR